MDDDFKDAIKLAVQMLQDRVDNLEAQLGDAFSKINQLERDLSFVENSKIAQIERDVYGLESDLRSHGH